MLTYVIKVRDAPKTSNCKGITIYWGTSTDWSYHSADYGFTAFSTHTGWGDFLTAYNT